MKSESIYIDMIRFLPDEFHYIFEIFYQGFRYLNENLENVISQIEILFFQKKEMKTISCKNKLQSDIGVCQERILVSKKL